MKKLKQASREALQQEYYQTAATVGDIDRQIRHLENTKNNLLSNMSVLLKRLDAMPLSKEEQAEVEEALKEQAEEQAEEEAANVTPDSNP